MKRYATLIVAVVLCLTALAAPAVHAQEGANRTATARLSAEAKQSITRGLEFLAATQNEDGSWGEGNISGATSLALMSFMLQGHIPGEGKYGKAMAQAIDFLILSLIHI